MGALPLGGVSVHANDLDRVTQKPLELVLDALGAHPVGTHVAALAVGAASRGVRVGAHGPAPATAMAHEGVRPLVVGEGTRAVRALRDGPALTTHQEVRETSPIEQEHGLLLSRRHPLERLGKRAREDRTTPCGELSGHVHDADLGQPCRAHAPWHRHMHPAGSTPAALTTALKALERGRRRTEHERAPPLLGQAGGNLAGVVARRTVLLV